MSLPVIIQGGMGIAVSDWRLARAVAATGQMGVVSGTALDAVLVRRLQAGDVGGHIRSALEAMPFSGVAERIHDAYFVDGGIDPASPYLRSPMPRPRPTTLSTDLLVAANFCEVYLAKRGHAGPVGINYLEKIQLPMLPSLFGAMMAGVEFVLMGAGIPRAIPGVLDGLSKGDTVALGFDVKGADERHTTSFDPTPYLDGGAPPVRPRFLAIVASHVLATMMARLERPADGFVVEGPTAGGHNAPPRGRMTLTDGGEPVYGDRDVVDLEAVRSLGLPFWLAGGQATAAALARAVDSGAVGVQVGTAFAFCEESGLDPDLRRETLTRAVGSRTARVYTDPIASPTGFPFKVVRSDGSDPVDRERVCDLGYLRTAYRKESGTIGWRCPAEPVKDYVRKGGDPAETEGRQCLCNALMANIGLGQVREGGDAEPAILTAGDDLADLGRFLSDGASGYSAADVVAALLAGN